MSISKEISELLDANVISQETAEKIRNYYQSKKEQTPNRLMLIFGILGAILIGLGIILVLTLGILIIIDGARKNHFGLLNYGLLIITALITCRFFDTGLSFVFRGMSFVIVGAGFFATNYWMLQKRRYYLVG